MNCKTFKESICEIIDKRIDDQQIKILLEHALQCPKCNYEYQSLRTAKHIVSKKFQRSNVPKEVYYKIVSSTSTPSPFSWLRKLFAQFYIPILILFAIATIGAGTYYFFSHQSTILSDESNIFSQSIKNYKAVTAGAMKPDVVGDENDIRTYLQREVQFPVNVPNIKECSWCGGIISELSGVKLAHVIFELSGKQLVYLYQSDIHDVLASKSIGIPDAAKKEIENAHWYIKEFDNNTTLIAWKYSSTLCVAVSAMNKTNLIAMLTETDRR